MPRKGSDHEAGEPERHDDARKRVVKRLRSRRAEIEDALAARIHHVAVDSGRCDHKDGERTAIVAILEYALTSIEHGDAYVPSIPPEAVKQAQGAARSGIGLGTVLRCYLAGYVLIENFVMQETGSSDLRDRGVTLRSIQETHSFLLDGLIASVSREYACEAQRVSSTPQRRTAERVRRLLAGEILDTEQLGYRMDTWHLGIVGTGGRAAQTLGSLTASLDCRLLPVTHGDDKIWAWLGGQSRQNVMGDVKRLLSTSWPDGVSLAFGEPAEGLEGWRLTHWQAQSAWLVSLRRPQRFTHYADVALLAPWLQPDAHARWLVNTYLSPLDNQKVPGATLRTTLRHYFAAGRNASAAASALRVSRRTMRNRMNLIEFALGASVVERHQAELELALQLEQLIKTHQRG
jgi:hypothetical protein